MKKTLAILLLAVFVMNVQTACSSETDGEEPMLRQELWGSVCKTVLSLTLHQVMVILKPLEILDSPCQQTIQTSPRRLAMSFYTKAIRFASSMAQTLGRIPKLAESPMPHRRNFATCLVRGLSTLRFRWQQMQQAFRLSRPITTNPLQEKVFTALMVKSFPKHLKREFILRMGWKRQNDSPFDIGIYRLPLRSSTV